MTFADWICNSKASGVLNKINGKESDWQQKMKIRKKATDAVQEFVK
jgi:hypothetical protein